MRRLLVMWGVGCVSPSDIDADLDGTPDAFDCGPDDARIFPGAVERCDGVDNNCDGRIDELLGTLYFPDGDGDGDGDSRGGQLWCTEPEVGWVLDGGDCDDLDPQVSSRVLERCNGIDDDCDLDIDEVAWSGDFDAALSAGEWGMNGDAEHEFEGTQGYLRLTDLGAQARGSAWFQQLVHPDGVRLEVSVFMDFGPGDGMTVALMTDWSPALLGLQGRDLGIYGVGARGTVLELDAAGTGGEDPGFPHVAVADVETRTAWATSGAVALGGGSWRRLAVEMEDDSVTAWLDGVRVVSGEVPGGLPETVMLGFTAANSTLVQLNRVDDVQLGCIPPDSL